MAPVPTIQYQAISSKAQGHNYRTIANWIEFEGLTIGNLMIDITTRSKRIDQNDSLGQRRMFSHKTFFRQTQ